MAMSSAEREALVPTPEQELRRAVLNAETKLREARYAFAESMHLTKDPRTKAVLTNYWTRLKELADQSFIELTEVKP